LYGHDFCDRCNSRLPEPESPINNPDDAYQRPGCLVVSLEGGYAMFHDNYHWHMDPNENKSFLCHDCAAELYKFLGRNDTHLHPYMDANGKPTDVRCCDFGFTF
jgi:hypothetical protein